MKHEFEEPTEYHTTISVTGEKVKLRRAKCKCGHSLNFLSQNARICNHCGRLVYPTKKSEFRDKMLKELKK